MSGSGGDLIAGEVMGDLELRIAELTEREATLANRELTVALAHAGLDFWRRLGDMPIDAALEIFHAEIKEAYALRRTKPPYQAEVLQ